MENTNHTNATHFKINLIKEETLVNGHITFSLLWLFIFLILTSGWASEFQRPNFCIILSTWIIWMASICSLFVLSLDIDFEQGFDGELNQQQIVNFALILIEISIFIMNLVWRKTRNTTRYIAVSTKDVEDYNNAV